jgi:hypothetical protein
VSEAKVGDVYRYVIHTPVDWNLTPIFRIYPYARKVTNAAGNGIIYDSQTFDWGDDIFKKVKTLPVGDGKGLETLWMLWAFGQGDKITPPVVFRDKRARSETKGSIFQ